MELKELLKMKPQIENIISPSGRNIGQREFLWLYTPGCPLKTVDDDFHPSFGYISEYGGRVFYKDFVLKRTGITAILHNHPSGHILPSYRDIELSLFRLLESENLKYNIIIATNGETSNNRVTGYFVMEYSGKRSKLYEIHEKIEKKISDSEVKRRALIEMFDKEMFGLGPNDTIFTLKERIDLSLECLNESKLLGSLYLMDGCAVGDWKVIRKDVNTTSPSALKYTTVKPHYRPKKR